MQQLKSRKHVIGFYILEEESRVSKWFIYQTIQESLWNGRWWVLKDGIEIKKSNAETSRKGVPKLVCQRGLVGSNLKWYARSILSKNLFLGDSH